MDYQKIYNNICERGKKERQLDSYCEKHHIDILLMHGDGGQINYIHPNMDVTAEFVNFLNENQAQIEKELN